MKPRDYQSEALEDVCAYLKEASGNPLVALPTGTGKSMVIAMLIERLRAKRDRRILVASHVKEIISQNSEALTMYNDSIPWGIYSAGLKRRDMHPPVIFASVQSIYKKVYDFDPFDVLIVDECHLVPPKGEGRYQTMIKKLVTNAPHVRVIGFTATPYRLGSGLLTEGNIFDDIAYEMTIQRAIDDGYLSPVVSRGSEIQINLEGVRVRQGDYVIGDLEKALKADHVTERALRECVERHSDRQSWLVFCVNVKHAEQARDILRSHGLESEMVTGDTPSNERASIIERFKQGKIRAVTNCNVLTTGFNAPCVDMLVCLRPTKSPVLYVQSIGRGTRLHPGKVDCLVKDFAGLVETHGPVDTVRARRQAIKKGKNKVIVRGVPCRQCPVCFKFVPIKRQECPCGFEFPEPPPHHEHASHRAILSRDATAEMEDVDFTRYMRHQKKGKPPCLRVEYMKGSHGLFRKIIVREFVCFEHGGFASRKAAIWWRQHGGKKPIPTTTAEALERLEELREPVAVRVNRAPKYPEVTGYVW